MIGLLAHGADPTWVDPNLKINALQAAKKLRKGKRIMDALRKRA